MCCCGGGDLAKAVAEAGTGAGNPAPARLLHRILKALGLV